MFTLFVIDLSFEMKWTMCIDLSNRLVVSWYIEGHLSFKTREAVQVYLRRWHYPFSLITNLIEAALTTHNWQK